MDDEYRRSVYSEDFGHDEKNLARGSNPTDAAHLNRRDLTPDIEIGAETTDLPTEFVPSTNCCIRNFNYAQNPVNDRSTIGTRILWYFRCPPHDILGLLITRVMAIIVGLAIVLVFNRLMIEDYIKCRKTILGLFCVYITARVFAYICVRTKVPDLLGMLIAGILLRNTLEFVEEISTDVKALLRNLAFIQILVRAGLSLSPKSLKRTKGSVFFLAWLPGICFEAPTVALMAYLLMGMDLAWGLMYGFTLAAVSPAVVVPAMLDIAAQGYDNGVPTLVITASSIDDVFAITAFAVAQAFAFAGNEVEGEEGLAEKLITVTYCTAGALIGGILFGIFLWYIPPPESKEDDDRTDIKSHTIARYLMLLAGCVLFFLLALWSKEDSAGPLACLVLSFVCGIGWTDEVKDPVSIGFAYSWNFVSPLLFGLIGTEIDLGDVIRDPKNLGFSVVVLLAGLAARCTAAYFATSPKLACSDNGCCEKKDVVEETDEDNKPQTWNRKERLFIACSWLPKATVQAAIGAVPMQHIDAMGPPSPNTTETWRVYQQQREWAQDILTGSVVAIMISASAGIVLINLLYRRCLIKRLQRAPSSTMMLFIQQNKPALLKNPEVISIMKAHSVSFSHEGPPHTARQRGTGGGNRKHIKPSSDLRETSDFRSDLLESVRS